MNFQQCIINLIQGQRLTREGLKGSYVVMEQFPEKTGNNLFLIDPNTKDRKNWEISEEDFKATDWTTIK